MYNPFIPILNSLLPEPQASLLSGILFGVKATMPKPLYQALIDTGTLHIIALSGMNITILSGLIARVTLFLGRKASSVLTIGVIILFILFVGTAPSIVRAGIMGGFSFLAIYFGRPYWAIASLLVASGIMLLVDLSLFSNLSFQLSFLATLGIIVSQKKVRAAAKSTGWVGKMNDSVKENFRMTLYAQIFTAPVILYNFHRFSLIAPATNIAIAWAIQPIMILGFVTALAGWIFLPLGFLFAWINWVLLTYVILVIEWFAKTPFASVEF